ncbi:M56 family metallopeptidase [Maribacter aquivivus]|uniref:M56 family metallopeptidase n=1 Tax=Maribacter aquivivus TaxID=228958 RepID=UPI0024931D58|nr:M56 family metallopeptidase [Maribacter aquivivus]
MGIFLLFYKLLLEKERMHHFKRFFLLTALVASFIIPQVVFTEYVETVPTAAVTQVLTLNEPQEITPVVHVIEKSPMNWSLILWTIYGLGVAVFGFRFLINLTKIWQRVKRNTLINNNFIVRVLLKEQLPPHTFLRYIFLNKQRFESKNIPDSVIKHEETHALQWHSLDVLFIELFQILFWFNPLIYVYKKTIKLNHEFIADSAVLNGQEDHLIYQNTLLSYLSNDSFYTHQSVGIANAINYSSIKKRFIIMKKQTSKKSILLRSLLLLPLLAIMLYSFSNRKEKFVSKPDDYSINGDWLNEENELETLTIIEKNENLLWGNNQGLILKFEKIKGQFYYYSELSKEKLLVEINAKEETIQVNGKKFIHKAKSLRDQLNGTWQNEKNKIKLIVSEYDIYMVFDLLEGNKKVVRYYPKKRGNSYYFTYGYEDWSFKIENNQLVDSRGNYYTKQEKNQEKSTINQYNALAKKYNAIPIEKRSITKSDLKILESTYKNMTSKERKAAQPFPECLPKENQDGASEEQMIKYNGLAKKYNSMIAEGGNIQILKSDVDELTYIYGLMSSKQKENVEPFPNFPKPPAVPKAAKAPNSTDYADTEIERIIATQDTYDGALMLHKANNLPHNNTTYINIDGELKYDDKKTENTRVYIFNSDSSKTKNNPNLMEDLRSLEKQNAQFYFEGEKISSEEGFEIIKNEKSIKIETLPYTNRQPEIKIYKKTNTNLIPPPPSPPTPPSPLDYAISMAKKGATFFYEGKKVSSDKAIDLLKKNKDLNIESREKNGKAEVRITKEPVTIE